jgi:uncharacterized protein YkwD
MRTGGRACSRAWSVHGLVLFLLLLIVPLAASGAGGRSPVARSTPAQHDVRLVLLSAATGAAARSAGTTSLYARNDPWRRYLASDATCPGGERTDLPTARQEATLACVINFARRMRGLQPLPIAPVLNGASTRKGQAIGRCGSFSHTPCGTGWAAWVRSIGYAGAFGENLSLSTGPFRAPRPVVDAWLNSRLHRETLFRADWREQGLAMVRLGALAEHENVTVWVSVLGRPSG